MTLSPCPTASVKSLAAAPQRRLMYITNTHDRRGRERETEREIERERERKRKRDRCKEGCKENKPGEMENKTEREREEREKKSAPYVRKRLCLIDNQLLKAGPVWGCLLP